MAKFGLYKKLGLPIFLSVFFISFICIFISSFKKTNPSIEIVNLKKNYLRVGNRDNISLKFEFNIKTVSFNWEIVDSTNILFVKPNSGVGDPKDIKVKLKNENDTGRIFFRIRPLKNGVQVTDLFYTLIIDPKILYSTVKPLGCEKNIPQDHNRTKTKNRRNTNTKDDKPKFKSINSIPVFKIDTSGRSFFWMCKLDSCKYHISILDQRSKDTAYKSDIYEDSIEPYNVKLENTYGNKFKCTRLITYRWYEIYVTAFIGKTKQNGYPYPYQFYLISNGNISDGECGQNKIPE